MAKYVLPAVVAGLAAVALFGPSRSTPVAAQEKAPAGPAAKWEYKTVPLQTSGKALQKELNDLGADGWEVAGTATTSSGPVMQLGPTGIVILKRPVR